MKDADCVDFLKWALPRLDLRWPGFRKVHKQVCKRVRRRLEALSLTTFEQYRDRLAGDPSEWSVLDGFCRITISRFYRDKRVFDVLGRDFLPALAERALSESRAVQCWCAGCASGEEVFTLRIIWNVAVRPIFPGVDFAIVGTDAEPTMIDRAHRGCFSPGSLKDLPVGWFARAFETSNGLNCVKACHRSGVTFFLQDIRYETPAGPFDLILCRNLVFTYFAPHLQSVVLDRIATRLRPNGYLVVGAHEALPQGDHGLEPIGECREIYRKTTAGRRISPPER